MKHQRPVSEHVFKFEVLRTYKETKEKMYFDENGDPKTPDQELHAQKLVQEIDYMANAAILKKNYDVAESLTNDFHLLQNEALFESVLKGVENLLEKSYALESPDLGESKGKLEKAEKYFAE